VTPVVISYQMGLNQVWGIAIEILFVLCGVIRLAYFNVLEELKHTDPQVEQKKGYRGLPITTITIIYPIVYLFRPLVSNDVFLILLAVMHLVVAFLYVLDFKLKKPGNAMISAMIVLVTAVMVCILFS
jgi:CDP-diacylglycerol--serine O-phosphatidyltransferase